MSLKRKGVEIGINVIIVAAIALLVLVVIAVLIFRGGGQLKESSDCAKFNGICENIDVSVGDTCASVLGEGYGPSAYSCQDPEQTCCIKVG